MSVLNLVALLDIVAEQILPVDIKLRVRIYGMRVMVYLVVRPTLVVEMVIRVVPILVHPVRYVQKVVWIVRVEEQQIGELINTDVLEAINAVTVVHA